VLAAGGVGWDWIGINLDDGGALMAFRIRDAAGNTLYAHASLRDAGGRLTRFGPGEVGFTPLRQLDLAAQRRAVPGADGNPLSARTRFETAPVADDQEISARRPLPVSYWEGLVAIRGTLAGRGYLELTGYAGALRLGTLFWSVRVEPVETQARNHDRSTAQPER
jgi:predicted secreted hydrolase